MPIRLRRMIEVAGLVAACLASGNLECGRPLPTRTQLHGRELYLRMCSVCHGRSGEGYAADQAPAITNPNFLESVTDDSLRAAISNGRSGTTMSAWSVARGGPLSLPDVDAIIDFLRGPDRRPRARLDEHEPTGDEGRGGAVFARECARCHGAHGTGGPNVAIGNPELLAGASNGFLRYAVYGGRPGTPMPAFEQSLDSAAVDDVLALLRSWQRSTPLPRTAPAHPPPLPLGPVPLHPHGPDPSGFHPYPATTPLDVIHKELERGARMAILDARAPSDYVREHIAGAVSVPFYDPEPYAASLPKDAWLVCYCACPHAESGQLAQKLVAKGFAKVTVLDEGLGVWRTRKYPMRQGSDP